MKDPWPDVVNAAMCGKQTSTVLKKGLTPDMLASAYLMHRAAAKFPRVRAKLVLLPPAIRGSLCPEQIIPIIATILQNPIFHRVIPELLEMLQQRHWYLPPEWLPCVMEIATKREALRTPLLWKSLGPTAAWLATQNPDWAIWYFAQLRWKKYPRQFSPPTLPVRVRWAALPYQTWKCYVLALAQNEQAWHTENSVLLDVLINSTHPWPKEIIPIWAAQLERTLRQYTPHPPPLWEALLHAAALRTTPMVVLDVLSAHLDKPPAWNKVIISAHDIATLRRRMHEVFQSC
ncbi:MAG: hypothetical protein NZM43_01635 [Saprospiraceae bacterium]|nr:hypothetical protein [Saprospiraceae bacterium]MDW8483002.1 hypothetical protein [Saprospiraceae bacterium]